jgi:cytidyltransferase-like protein
MIVENKEKLKQIIDCAKKENKKVLIKRGVFDIIHPGHVFAINFLKKQTDILILGTVSNEYIKKVKCKKRPINDQRQRSEVLAAIKGVDYVFEDKSVSRNESIKLLQFLKPTILAITLGDLQKTKEYTNSDWKLLEIPDKKKTGFSTTDIINRILERYKT